MTARSLTAEEKELLEFVTAAEWRVTGPSVYDWLDATGRTTAEVVAALREAAGKAEGS